MSTEHTPVPEDAPIPVQHGYHGPFAALRYRDFRLYWGGQFVSVAGTQMQMAAVAWQVYELTHDAAALGVMGLVRVLPIIVFSLAGGVVADVLDRRRMLIVTQSVLLAVSLALAAVTLAGSMTLWIILALTALDSAAVAFDSPARQALVPSLVTPEQLPNALSLSSTTTEVAAIAGPSVAGVLIATSGIATVYAFDAISSIAILIALCIIRAPIVVGAAQHISLNAALDGLRFVFGTPIIIANMGLDFVATFFGSATALLPIFAHDILHVGSQGYGVLYAAPAVGAVCSGFVMSIVAHRIRYKGRFILVAVGAYAVSTILFGLSRNFEFSLCALAGIGAADTVSMILRQTVRQTVTSDALRGRMSSVNMIFFMGGPQLGEFEAGLVARSFGAPFSVISGGVAAMAATGLIAALAVRLRQYRG